MTSLDTLASFIEQRIADAEADLDPENIGWIGMDAMNRARGRVSALREVESFLRGFRLEDDRISARADLFAKKRLGQENLAEEKWQNLRDSGYDDTELRRAGGDR